MLVGGDLTLSGDDSHRTTGRNGVEPVSGLALQALIVDTILAGLPIHEAPSLPFELALVALGGVAAALALSARRPRRIAVVVVAGAIGYVALAFSWFASTLTMLPVTGPLLTLGGCLGLSLLLRSGLPSAPEWALEEGQ